MCEINSCHYYVCTSSVLLCYVDHVGPKLTCSMHKENKTHTLVKYMSSKIKLNKQTTKIKKLSLS